MFYQELQNFCNEYKELINMNLIKKIDKWIAFLDEDERKNINPYKMSKELKIKVEIIQEILEKLSKEGFLRKKILIRCEYCGHVLVECYENEFYDKSIELREQIKCYNCDNEIRDLKKENIELRYEVIGKLSNNPEKIKQDMQKILRTTEEDLIQNTLDKANYDYNKLFFNPTEEEMKELSRLFCGITSANSNDSKGKAFEKFTVYLFNLIKCVNATGKCTTDTNQIDVYAKNMSPFKNGVLDRMGEFIICECKNEAKTPENGYFYKLLGIIDKDRVDNTEKRVGMFFSKVKSPSTFKEMAKSEFLRKKITIITFYYDELKEIVEGKKNFLGCIDYKMRIIEGSIIEKDEVEKIFV